jgi:hypothetical protein
VLGLVGGGCCGGCVCQGWCADELSGPDRGVADVLVFQCGQACFVVGVGDDSKTVRTDGIIRVVESSPVQVVDQFLS